MTRAERERLICTLALVSVRSESATRPVLTIRRMIILQLVDSEA